MPEAEWPCLSAHEQGTCLIVHVVPNARRSEVAGMHDGCLRIRVAAPPLDSRANEALVAWLADSLGLARRDVQLLAGAASRRKRLLLRTQPQRVADWLRSRLP